MTWKHCHNVVGGSEDVDLAAVLSHPPLSRFLLPIAGLPGDRLLPSLQLLLQASCKRGGTVRKHRRWNPPTPEWSASAPNCLVRCLSKCNTCRNCSSSMEGAMTITPPHWPPLGATETLLEGYERAPAKEDGATTVMDTGSSTDVTMDDPSRPFASVSLTALKAEITRVERHLSETRSASPALCEALTFHHMAARRNKNPGSRKGTF